MSINTVIKYLFNRKSIPSPRKINTETIKYFIQGHVRKFAKNFGLVDDYILEQASEREKRVKALSPRCFNEGKCYACLCSLEETLISEASCVHGCFGKMLKKDDWNNYKN